MNISFNWLQDYIKISETPDEVAALLTQSGLEVGELKKIDFTPGHLEGLLIGEVVECRLHPNADQLKITRVDIGQKDLLQIVCGAPNVAIGQMVVVAPVGAKLMGLGDTVLKIKKSKIRGEASEGMLCAEDEIGLGDAHEGIIVLDTRLSAGTPAAQYFKGYSDTILEIELTPNRGDACSHLGVARELSALLDRPLQYSFTKGPQVTKSFLPIAIKGVDAEACPRYTGVVIKNVKVAASPDWLQHRLRAIGLTPINNVVDVTNFVMHALGQPLHAFDYDALQGHQISVTQVTAGSSFITLDGAERVLSGTELMICDELGPIGMAGILGGQRTGIQPETQNVFLESAYFIPSVVRRAAKQHGLQTDASFRYERGTDPHLPLHALQKAASLLQEVAQGVVASEWVDIYPNKIEGTNVKVRYKRVQQLLGQQIAPETMHTIMNRLGIEVREKGESSFVAKVPPYRTDVKREIDIIEEIARIYGYSRIETAGMLSSSYLAHSRNSRPPLRAEVASLLTAHGYYELYANSLTRSSYTTLLRGTGAPEPVVIANPLSESLDMLRQTLLFGGLETIARNVNRKQGDLKLFEFGNVYGRTEGRYIEANKLGIWITGNFKALNWMEQVRAVTFQDLQEVVYKMLYRLGITDFATRPGHNEWYAEGIEIAQGPQQLVSIGRVSESILQALHVSQPVFFADISWDSIREYQQPAVRYQPLSKFPSVKRDISLVIDSAIHFEDIKEVIASQKSPFIQDVTVFDVYEGGALSEHQKAYALSFLLQGGDRTLDDRTIDGLMGRLMKAFETALGARVRT